MTMPVASREAIGKQSRAMSLAEAVTNVVVGYGVAVLTQILVFPLFGLHASLAENMAIGAVFAVSSVVRGYTLRRLFEAIGMQAGRTGDRRLARGGGRGER